MKTIKSFLCAVLFLMGIGMASAQSNSTDTVDAHLTGFDRIKIQGPFKVYITQGTEESVKLIASQEALGRITSTVEGQTLNLRNKYESWSWGPKKWFSGNNRDYNQVERVIVYITLRDLNSLSISGSGNVAFTSPIATKALDVQLRGSADLSGKINTQQLDATISGSGNIKLAGTATDAKVKISGSGKFSALDLATENANVHISGSGDASVNASNQVNAALHGSADLRYTGTASINTIKTGSASVRKL